MATYKFPQFNVEIIDPTIHIEQINDKARDKTCSVDVLFETDSAKYMHTFVGYTYADTWQDVDIENWVINSELPRFKI